MPPARPGSLDGRTYTEIEAYLLQENGGKAGPAPLAASTALADTASSPQRQPRRSDRRCRAHRQ